MIMKDIVSWCEPDCECPKCEIKFNFTNRDPEEEEGDCCGGNCHCE